MSSLAMTDMYENASSAPIGPHAQTDAGTGIPGSFRSSILSYVDGWSVSICFNFRPAETNMQRYEPSAGKD